MILVGSQNDDVNSRESDARLVEPRLPTSSSFGQLFCQNNNFRSLLDKIVFALAR